jgi:hypothetical protein
MADIKLLANHLQINTTLYGWLFRYSPEYVLNMIAMIGTIGGGSIMTCYNSKFPVHDIDIFVDSKKKMVEIFNIINYNFKISKVSRLKSVIQIDLIDNPSFQLIMVNCIEPDTLISKFDFDCVRCAYHNQTFFCSDSFEDAIETGIIKKYNTQLNVDRLNKIVKKGFVLPYELEFIRNTKKINHKTSKYWVININDVNNIDFSPLINRSDYMAENIINIDIEKEEDNIVVNISNTKNLMYSQKFFELNFVPFYYHNNINTCYFMDHQILEFIENYNNKPIISKVFHEELNSKNYRGIFKFKIVDNNIWPVLIKIIHFDDLNIDPVKYLINNNHKLNYKKMTDRSIPRVYDSNTKSLLNKFDIYYIDIKGIDKFNLEFTVDRKLHDSVNVISFNDNDITKYLKNEVGDIKTIVSRDGLCVGETYNELVSFYRVDSYENKSPYVKIKLF